MTTQRTTDAGKTMGEPVIQRGPTSADGVAALADAFERSADWLDKGVLHGPKRTHPLVGTADYREAAALLRSMKKEPTP